MKRLCRLLPALILALPLCAAGDAAKGKEIYMKKCKSCHAEDGAGTAPMKKKFAEKLKPLASKEVQAKKDAALTQSIKTLTNHKAAAATLADADIANLIAFMRTLK
jgi:mono/diheme cytochrome c family protein